MNRPRKNSGLGKRWITVLTILCALLSGYFGIMFYKTQGAYRRGEEDLALIREICGNPSGHAERGWTGLMEEARQTTEVKEHAERLNGYLRLKERNQDLVGWIRIGGTSVNYPVMHKPGEPDYYLRRGFDRQYSVYGMIYLDATCRSEDTCNYILYGHHMKNGSMFAPLENYTQESYCREHPYVELDLLGGEERGGNSHDGAGPEDIKAGDSGAEDGQTGENCDYVGGVYEVFAAFKMPASQINLEFARELAARSREDYDRLIEHCMKNSFYDTGLTATWPETLVTLTTCEYSQKDGRIFVIAKRKRDG